MSTIVSPPDRARRGPEFACTALRRPPQGSIRRCRQDRRKVESPAPSHTGRAIAVRRSEGSDRMWWTSGQPDVRSKGCFDARTTARSQARTGTGKLGSRSYDLLRRFRSLIAVICMKWGTVFEPDYVNVLYQAVSRALHRPFQFYCFTDDPAGLDDGIVARPLPDLGFLPKKRCRMGCWPKIGIFQSGLIEEDCALFLDLDVVVTGPLDAFFDHQHRHGGLHILREWNSGLWNLLPLRMRPDRGAQSSVFAWRPIEQHHIYDALRADPNSSFAQNKNDQQFIRRTAIGLRYWPHAWAVSFKKSCVWPYPLNYILPDRRPPGSASLVVFYGAPRPHEVARGGNERWGTSRRFGYGPLGWMQAYWSGKDQAGFSRRGRSNYDRAVIVGEARQTSSSVDENGAEAYLPSTMRHENHPLASSTRAPLASRLRSGIFGLLRHRSPR